MAESRTNEHMITAEVWHISIQLQHHLVLYSNSLLYGSKGIHNIMSSKPLETHECVKTRNGAIYEKIVEINLGITSLRKK